MERGAGYTGYFKVLEIIVGLFCILGYALTATE